MGDETTFHVRNAIAGDDQSIGWLVGRLAPLLKSQAFYRLGPQLSRVVDPEDLVAEAWLATLPKLRGLEIRGDRATPVLLSYVGTVIRNRATQRLREFARRGMVGKEMREGAVLPPQIRSAAAEAMEREH